MRGMLSVLSMLCYGTRPKDAENSARHTKQVYRRIEDLRIVVVDYLQ